MEFPVKTGAPARQRTECAILPVFDDRALHGATKDFDRAARGAITKLVRAGDAPSRLGSCTLVHRTQGTAAARWLLVGCGKRADFSAKRFTTALGAAIHALRSGGTQGSDELLGLRQRLDRSRHGAPQRRDGAREPLPFRRAQEPQRPAVAARAARLGLPSGTDCERGPRRHQGRHGDRRPAATSRATSATARPTSARRRISRKRRATSRSATTAWKSRCSTRPTCASSAWAHCSPSRKAPTSRRG